MAVTRDQEKRGNHYITVVACKSGSDTDEYVKSFEIFLIFTFSIVFARKISSRYPSSTIHFWKWFGCLMDLEDSILLHTSTKLSSRSSTLNPLVWKRLSDLKKSSPLARRELRVTIFATQKFYMILSSEFLNYRNTSLQRMQALQSLPREHHGSLVRWKIILYTIYFHILRVIQKLLFAHIRFQLNFVSFLIYDFPILLKNCERIKSLDRACLASTLSPSNSELPNLVKN